MAKNIDKLGRMMEVMEKNSPSLESLRSVLEAADRSRVTKADFDDLAMQIIELVKAIKSNNETRTGEMSRMVASSISSLESRMQKDLSEIRSSVQSVVDNAINTLNFQHESLLSEVDKKMAEVVNGIDGIDGEDGKDGKDGKDGSPDTPEQVRDKLETLSGEERLDAGAIKNLQNFITRVGGATRGFMLRVAGVKQGMVNEVDFTGTGVSHSLVNGLPTVTITRGDVSKVGTPVNNQVGVWTGDGTLEGDANLTFTGDILTVTNDTDQASNQVLVLQGDRATPATGDTIYQSFLMSDSAGNQDEMARIEVYADDVTSTSEDARFRIYLRAAGTTAVKYHLLPNSFYPGANDGASLGTSSIGWSDLFLAEGGVINWDNGDATLTQSGDLLSLAGAVLALPNVALSAASADTIRIASADLSAGNTMLAIYGEGTSVGSGTPTANRTIAIQVNGTTYYLLASTIP